MNKKNLLFIGVGFQQYNDYLVEYLSKAYNLHHYGTGEFKREHGLFMAWAKYFPSEVRKAYRKSLLKYIEKIKDCHFDYILVLKGTYMQDEHLELLKKHHPDSRLVLYMWDSLKNMDNGDVLRKHFKVIYSFDSEDCKKYGFGLRPLFYIQSGQTKKYTYDVSFVGNNHSDRLKMTQELKGFCKANGISYRFIIPVGGKTYNKAKYQKMHFLHNDIDIISAGRMAYDEYLALTQSSKTVIDIPSPNQSGLSIRTIESLAFGARVITTNKHIIEYDSIPKDMYYVWDRQFDKGLLDFIKMPQREYCIDPFFSLESFVGDLLNDTEDRIL